MRLRVTGRMTARFFDCQVHPVYATFAIVEHCEYASRQAILKFLDPEEDAVGSAVTLGHRSAVPVGALVSITARIVEAEGRRILCRLEVRWKETIVAEGTVEQRVVLRQRLRAMIEAIYQPDQNEEAI